MKLKNLVALIFLLINSIILPAQINLDSAGHKKFEDNQTTIEAGIESGINFNLKKYTTNQILQAVVNNPAVIEIPAPAIQVWPMVFGEKFTTNPTIKNKRRIKNTRARANSVFSATEWSLTGNSGITGSEFFGDYRCSAYNF